MARTVTRRAEGRLKDHWMDAASVRRHAVDPHARLREGRPGCRDPPRAGRRSADHTCVLDEPVGTRRRRVTLHSNVTLLGWHAPQVVSVYDSLRRVDQERAAVTRDLGSAGQESEAVLGRKDGGGVNRTRAGFRSPSAGTKRPSGLNVAATPRCTDPTRSIGAPALGLERSCSVLGAVASTVASTVG